VTPPVVTTAGLQRVLGQNARALTALFGEPELDVREAQARKLPGFRKVEHWRDEVARRMRQ